MPAAIIRPGLPVSEWSSARRAEAPRGSLRRLHPMPAGVLRPLTCRASVERFVLDRHRIVQGEPAAVGIDGLRGDIARVLRSEEDGNGGDFVGLADAAHGRARRDRALGVLVGCYRL